jgi:hypothetical protein
LVFDIALCLGFGLYRYLGPGFCGGGGGVMVLVGQGGDFFVKAHGSGGCAALMQGYDKTQEPSAPKKMLASDHSRRNNAEQTRLNLTQRWNNSIHTPSGVLIGAV